MRKKWFFSEKERRGRSDLKEKEKGYKRLYKKDKEGLGNKEGKYKEVRD